MARPKREDYEWPNLYRKATDKYIDQLEDERKSANEFIIDIAKLLNIDADGIGFDGLQLSIDDFKEAINKLEAERKWISVKDRLPSKEDIGKEFLCLVNVETQFQEYEIVEWFDPMIDDASEEHEKPHFNNKVSVCDKQTMNREVAYWMQLPEPPK